MISTFKYLYASMRLFRTFPYRRVWRRFFMSTLELVYLYALSMSLYVFCRFKRSFTSACVWLRSDNQNIISLTPFVVFLFRVIANNPLFYKMFKNEAVPQMKKNVLFPFRRHSFLYITWKKILRAEKVTTNFRISL